MVDAVSRVSSAQQDIAAGVPPRPMAPEWRVSPPSLGDAEIDGCRPVQGFEKRRKGLFQRFAVALADEAITRAGESVHVGAEGQPFPGLGGRIQHAATVVVSDDASCAIWARKPQSRGSSPTPKARWLRGLPPPSGPWQARLDAGGRLGFAGEARKVDRTPARDLGRDPRDCACGMRWEWAVETGNPPSRLRQLQHHEGRGGGQAVLVTPPRGAEDGAPRKAASLFLDSRDVQGRVPRLRALRSESSEPGSGFGGLGGPC